MFGSPPGVDGRAGLYDFTICAPGGRRVTTGDGLTLTVAAGLDTLARADSVVVPGYMTWDSPPSRPVLRALSAAAERGARVLSICIGAFALGHAGLLDGIRATTHWAAAPHLAALFPATEVVPDVLYVDEGDVLTSAGLAAGLDLCLHVVRRDHGATAAAELARWNVVAPHRDGGQAQFIATPVAVAPGTGLGATCAWAAERLATPLTLADLARHAMLSERTLIRRFRAETGLSPKQWLPACGSSAPASCSRPAP